MQSSASVIRKLVENISKNGNLCLNISPKADGTIPEDQQEVLRQAGRWLKVNGEGVYGTRAWMVYGEGPGIDFNKSEVDIRFTQKGDHEVYAFVIRYAGNKLLIRSFTNTNLGKVKRVSLLGYEEKVEFNQTAQGLEIILPDITPEGIIVFKVEI